MSIFTPGVLRSIPDDFWKDIAGGDTSYLDQVYGEMESLNYRYSFTEVKIYYREDKVPHRSYNMQIDVTSNINGVDKDHVAYVAFDENSDLLHVFYRLLACIDAFKIRELEYQLKLLNESTTEEKIDED